MEVTKYESGYMRISDNKICITAFKETRGIDLVVYGTLDVLYGCIDLPLENIAKEYQDIIIEYFKEE